MAGAPHSRATTVYDADRNSQSAPDLVAYPNQFFFWLYRESIAIFTLALAPELFAVEEFTIIPEGAGFGRDICVFISFVPDIYVGHIFSSEVLNKPVCGILGLRTPDAIKRAVVIILAVIVGNHTKQALFAFIRHLTTST
jgi:hypothetical protein